MTRVYIMSENSYYIGDDESIIKNAIKFEDVDIDSKKEFKVIDGEIIQKANEY